MNILAIVFLISVLVVLLAICVDVCCQVYAEKLAKREALQPKTQKAVPTPKKPTSGRHRLSAVR